MICVFFYISVLFSYIFSAVFSIFFLVYLKWTCAIFLKLFKNSSLLILLLYSYSPNIFFIFVSFLHWCIWFWLSLICPSTFNLYVHFLPVYEITRCFWVAVFLWNIYLPWNIYFSSASRTLPYIKSSVTTMSYESLSPFILNMYIVPKDLFNPSDFKIIHFLYSLPLCDCFW